MASRCKIIAIFILGLFLCNAALLHAQSWQLVGGESFEAIAGVSDGALVLVRYPGDVLRSTDAGATWHEVYHSVKRLTGIAELAPDTCVALGDGRVLLSNDSGRSWAALDSSDNPSEYAALVAEYPRTDPLNIIARGARITLDDSSNIILSHDGGKSWQRVLTLQKKYPAELLALGLANSLCYAVGEPGLIYVSDPSFVHWHPLHAAPFQDRNRSRIASTVQFLSAASGMIAKGNSIYFTHDSGTTWSEYLIPDTSRMTSSLLISDTSALIGESNGRITSLNNSCDRNYDSVSIAARISDSAPIVQIGWIDKSLDQLFVLTDSAIYFTNSSLGSINAERLPLRPGEFAKAVSFPDRYTAYLLTDSVHRIDTTLWINTMPIDTTLVFDTGYIYRSTDGGTTWFSAMNGAPGLSNLFFSSAKRGYVCGARGLILRTDDSGMTWSRTYSFIRQNFHDVLFVNDSMGYAVGDSGSVLMTQISGRWWRPVPPESLFLHPATEYTSIAFPDNHTVFVLGDDRCYKQRIPDPVSWHITRRQAQRNNLHITTSPNPSTGIVRFTITYSGANGSIPAGVPSLRICDVAGRPLLNDVTCSESTPGQWTAESDLSSMPYGVYVALISIGSDAARSNFVIER